MENSDMEKMVESNVETEIETDPNIVVYFENTDKKTNLIEEIDDDKFDFNTMKADIMKKVNALQLQDVSNSFTQADVDKAAFPESLKIEEEKERIKFEKKSQMRAYKRTSNLLNEAYASEHKREALEKQLAQHEAKLERERGVYTQQFEQDKLKVQEKIDALKKEMFEFGKAHQGDAMASKSEEVNAMREKMQGYNMEIEELQRGYNLKIAQNLSELDVAKAQIMKAKEEENFCKCVVKTWVANQQEKKQPFMMAVQTGVKEICEYSDEKKEIKVDKKEKPTRRQQVINALKQIYYFLCKKLKGAKREKAIETGKRAITKERNLDQTLDVYVNNERASPSRINSTKSF